MSETSGRCRAEMDDCHGSNTMLVLADALDRLAADVAAVKAKVDSVEPEDVRHLVESEKAWVALVEEQRDAARYALADAQAEVERLKAELAAAQAETQRIQDEADDREQTEKVKRLSAENEKAHRTLLNRTWERGIAKAEVERLRAELAARPAVDARPMGWIARHEHAPPVGKYVMGRWDVAARQGYAREVRYGVAKRGPDGMWRSPTGVEKIAPTHWMPLPPGVEGGDEWEEPPAAARPATGIQTAPEPDYYLVTNERGMPIHVCRQDPGVGWDGCTITALYAHPQLPAQTAAGWLTDRERHVLSSMLSERPCDWSLNWQDDIQPAFRSILARAGSPPVVEVPEISKRDVPMQNEAMAYRAALDKAGVAWKEVPRE